METLEIEGFAQEFPDLAANADGIALSKDGCRAYFVTLRPEMAKRLLAFNTDNYRKLRVKHIDLLSQEMRTNDFLMNGDPLRIREDNILLDGQHRLEALASQDGFVEVEFLVVDKLPESVINTIDAAALTRSYIDHLRRRGFQNATNRSAVVVLYEKWLADRPLDSSYASTIRKLNLAHDPNEDRITWAVSNGLSLARKIKGIQPALVTLAFLILGEISQTAVKSLFVGTAEGENIHRGMPAYTLKKRLQEDWDDSRKRLKAEQLWFVFRCFEIELKNTMRPPSDQMTIHRLLPVPPQGVSTRDLKNMLVTE